MGPASSLQLGSSCSQLRRKGFPSLEGGAPRVRPSLLLSNLAPCLLSHSVSAQRWRGTEGPRGVAGEAPRSGTFNRVSWLHWTEVLSLVSWHQAGKGDDPCVRKRLFVPWTA